MDREQFLMLAQLRGWIYEIGYVDAKGTYKTFGWTDSDDHSFLFEVIRKHGLGEPQAKRLFTELNN